MLRFFISAWAETQHTGVSELAICATLTTLKKRQRIVV